ncbi:hypothetical protein E3P96_03163 [Wallemia ichthyophaga]|nr:hypothetical protein E3P96_03163 [Wallemia ichthyophaga]
MREKRQQKSNTQTTEEICRDVVRHLSTAQIPIKPLPSVEEVLRESHLAFVRGEGVSNVIERLKGARLTAARLPGAWVELLADIAHRSFVSVLAGVTLQIYGTFTLLSGYNNHKQMRLEALERHQMSLKEEEKQI